MVVPERASHWDYFHLLGSSEDKNKFNYTVKLYLLFVDKDADDGTREYILSRVVQALGALSNNLRAGAFGLLCTLLVNCPQQCSFETLNKLINNHLKPLGTMKADAEAYVGQLLAYKAIIQSGLLNKTPRLYSDIADGLMELSMRKSYLHSESLNLLSQITQKTQMEFGSDAFIAHLKNLGVATLDKLHYLLKVDQNIETSEILAHALGGKRFLATDCAAEIGSHVANCHNPSHQFFVDFLDAVADNHKYLSKFWKSFELNIKDKIGSSKPSLEMYYTLLSSTLKALQAKKQFKTVQVVVSDVAAHSLLKNYKSKPELTREACKCIAGILTSAEDSKLSLDILNKFVFSVDSFSFDEDTGSKVIGSAWRSLDGNDTKDFGNKCLEAVVKGEGLKNKDRLNALTIYCSLLSKPVVLMENEWRVIGMKSLLKAGLINTNNVSSEFAAVIRKSFFNLLSIKFPTLLAYASALKELTQCLDKSMKKGTLRVKVTEEMDKAFKLSQKLKISLEKKTKIANQDSQVIIQALELLTCFIALKSIYEPKDSQFNLTDIESVFQRITNSENDSEGPEWIEVLVDLFLNMLSKPNVSNRTIINIVFKTIVPHLNDGAFSQIVDVLNPTYDLNKTDNVEDGSDNEEEANEEAVSDSDESEEESSTSEDDTEEEDDDDESELDDEMNEHAFNQEKLQFELRKALTPADDSDNESINIDDLDEEQGRQLDATLSAIFKSAMVKKKPSKRESVTSHFRTRVIDLLETYCLTGMPLDHWLTLIPAILKLANSVVADKNTVGLKQRILSFVRKISSIKISDISSEDSDVHLLVDLLQELITQASNVTGTALDLKQHYLEMIKFCLRNISHVHPNKVNATNELLGKVVDAAVETFFSEKNALTQEFLMFLCQHSWSGVHNVAQKVIEHTFSKLVKLFKRIQGIHLLTSYFKSDRLFTKMSDSDVKIVKTLLNSLLAALVNFKQDGLLDAKTQQLITGLITEVHSSKCSGHVKWKKWKEQIVQILSVPQSKKCLKPFEMMCKKLDLSPENFGDQEPSNTSSGKQIEVESKQTQSPKKNNRKRKQVDARKLKKESKRLRLAAMDGLDENFSWSKLATDD